MIPDLQPFQSLRIEVRPDFDEIFDDMPDGCVAMRGSTVYVRESMWPMLKAELEQMPRMQ
jgi:hypothetical protein